MSGPSSVKLIYELDIHSDDHVIFFELSRIYMVLQRNQNHHDQIESYVYNFNDAIGDRFTPFLNISSLKPISA